MRGGAIPTRPEDALPAPSAPVASRRGACPSLAAPMLTGDGLLVRLRPAAPGFTVRETRVLADAARRFGNGLLDVTARGNLQVRGLTEASAGRLRQFLEAEDIAFQAGVSIETPPLAGLDPAETGDSLAMAERLRRALSGLSPTLAPKLSVIVDGGGLSSLDAVSADLRLRALPAGAGGAWQLMIDGTAVTARPGGTFDAGMAPRALVALLLRLSAMGPTARGRDLDPAAVSAVLAGLPGIEAEKYRPGPAFQPVGLHPLGAGGAALGAGPAYGQVAAEDLAALAEAVRASGNDEIRLSPGRALLVPCRGGTDIAALRAVAAGLGLRVDADDPANRIDACAGRRGCASAHLDTHALADRIRRAAPVLFDGSLRLHVSGCAKGCARPSPADLVLVGMPEGCALLRDAKPSAPPLVIFAEAAADRVAARLEAFVAAEKRSGESARACLTRLDPAALAALATERT
ncbi:precorrin-3B synthase [Ensifer soli]|uniref:precorrin-3B synthase n=1 Tax=Ciceribacter sp. sgz301302 TaxID=3342379 RepID=UPI0035B7604D